MTRGKAEGHFSDALVTAAAELVRDRWRPEPAPRWVTAIPVGAPPDARAGLRATPGGGARAALPRRPGGRAGAGAADDGEQRPAGAECRGHRSRWPAPPADAPVLLVDDLVDSRWTLTYAGWLLREAGVPAVHPLALAVAGTSDGEG